MLRRGCALIIVLLLALLVVMFVTCPKEEDHRLAVMQLCSEVVQTKVEESDVSKWLKATGIDLGDSKQLLLEATGNVSSGVLVNNLLHVDDYYLFSVGRMKVQHNEYIVSVGVMNHVFTPSKETVSEAIDNYLHR